MNRQALQDLQTSLGWLEMEKLKDEYLATLKATEARTDNQFDLTWDTAYNKGGYDHINLFFNYLEDEARKL